MADKKKGRKWIPWSTWGQLQSETKKDGFIVRNYGKSEYVKFKSPKTTSDEPDMVVNIPLKGELEEYYGEYEPRDRKRKNLTIPMEIPDPNDYENDVILEWMGKRGEWIVTTYSKWREDGSSYDESHGGPYKPTRELLAHLLDVFCISQEKVSLEQAHKMSPSELEKIAESPLNRNTREFILELLHEAGFEDEANSEWFERSIETIGLMPFSYHFERGHTALGVLINDDWAIKFDRMPRIGIEHTIYTSGHFGEFSPLVPSAKENGFSVTADEKYGALILENVNKRLKNGYMIAQEIAGGYGLRLKGSLDFNLFMMGLFHKCADKDKELRKKLGMVPYADIRGIPHQLAGNIPLKGTEGLAYERFMETAVPTDQIVGIIDHYNAILEVQYSGGLLSVIHGDWKPENLVNGFLVDFAMVGLAKKVDEMAYRLSDMRMRMGLEGFHRCIDRYIELRSSHDRQFSELMKYGGREGTHELADSAFLKQLTLRHSVMKKRDMNDDNKYRERMYYQQRIREVLREGRFV